MFVAEPHLTTDFLREVLHTLGEHIYLAASEHSFGDFWQFGPGVVAIHAAAGDGERTIDLGALHTAYDLLELDENLEPRIGWASKQFLKVSMRLGQTSIYRLTPVSTPGI